MYNELRIIKKNVRPDFKPISAHLSIRNVYYK